MMKSLFLQVAGVRSVDEALMLADEGVTHLGYPLVLDHHPEDLPREEVGRLVRTVGDAATHVVITYLTRAEEIVALARDVGATVCQLHAPVTLETLQRMKERAPDLSIIKSVVFHREDSAGTIDRALECAPWIDLFITDTFDPDTGASGATGKTHDWKLSAALVSRSPRPVILAGGLTPANVEEAIRVVRPAGVDVHTGVEDAAGHKDRGLVRAFVRAGRRGLREISPDSP